MNDNFAELCTYIRERTPEEIVLAWDLYGEDLRRREYIAACKECNVVGAVAEMYFEWSQCTESEYNKYNKKMLANICANLNSFIEVYNMLEDSVSREIYYDICMWRVSLRSNYLVDAYRKSTAATVRQYYDPIISLSDKETYVDAGGYIGDSIQDFLSQVQSYGKIYCYEPDSNNIAKAKENLKLYENIIYKNLGLGEKRTTAKFSNMGLSSSSILHDTDEGDIVDIVTLDEDIEQKITFLKMDIEGEELGALRGAKRHIVEDRPILAICLYHNVEDIYAIPQYIGSIVDNYRFCIRHYTPFHGETVLYAIPNERWKEK